MKEIWDDIADWSPLALTALWVLAMVFNVRASFEPATIYDFAGGKLIIGRPSWAMALLPVSFIWYYGVYRASVARTPNAVRSPSGLYLIALIAFAICMICSALLYEQRDNPQPALVWLTSVSLWFVIIGAFASIWISAAALLHHEKGSPPRALDVFGAFLLASFQPFSFWLLRSRVRKMLERPPLDQRAAP